MQVREFVVESVEQKDHRGRFRQALGALLLALGIVVAVFPEILVILISSAIAAAGIGLLISGFRARSRPRRVMEPRDVFSRAR